jgi:hypothetical protein
MHTLSTLSGTCLEDPAREQTLVRDLHSQPRSMSYHCRETQRILSDFSEAELPSVDRSADVPDGREGDLTKRPQKRGEVHDKKNMSRWNASDSRSQASFVPLDDSC